MDNLNEVLRQFNKDSASFEHFVLDDIQHWDQERNQLVSARLEIFGRSLLVDKLSFEEQNKISFTGDEPMECRVDLSSDTNTYIVTLMNDKDLMFIMPEHKVNLINEYYFNLNPENLVSYMARVNEVLVELFKYIDDLADVTIHFIEEQPAIFFLSFENLMMFDCYIEALNKSKYSRALFSDETARQRFADNNYVYIKSNKNKVDSFFNNEFRFFQKLLEEKSQDVDLLVAYLFLFNIVMQRYSLKWTEAHGGSFEDIESADLNSLLERFCSLESVSPYDVDMQGTFFYYLQNHRKFEDDSKILINMEKYRQLLKTHLDAVKFNNFKNRLKKEPKTQKYSIDDVDLMDGQEFENFVALIFSKMGYQTEVTKASGDQGIDVVAIKDEKRIGVQAKCYSSTVGNSAIQEAVAGKAFYRLDKVIVATNNFFTNSATQLAQANGIILWDRNMLKEKITEVVN